VHVSRWPIFKILSLFNSARNLQENFCHVSHHTLRMLLHYLAKLKKHLAIFPLQLLQKYTRYIEYVYTLRNSNYTFAIFLLQLLQKDTSKFIYFYLMYFILSDTYYHNMLLIQHQLPVICEICCEFFIFQQNNMSAHWACTASVCVSVSNFRRSKWDIPTFILMGLWPQHPDIYEFNEL